MMLTKQYNIMYCVKNMVLLCIVLLWLSSGFIWLNVDDFILSYDDTPLELVENAKYLGMFTNCDIS